MTDHRSLTKIGFLNIQNGFIASFTLILLGYFTVWLPNQNVGLAFIGIDISEWSKFLPQMQQGELPNRDLFYLPPITLALMMLLFTADWSSKRWQTWLMRGLAILVSVLAFPSFEAVRFEEASQWRPRLIMIGMVVVCAFGSHFLSCLSLKVPYVLLLLCGLAGALLPTWLFFSVRQVVSELLGMPIGIGLGVWLNLIGHFLVALLSGRSLIQIRP